MKGKLNSVFDRDVKNIINYDVLGKVRQLSKHYQIF